MLNPSGLKTTAAQQALSKSVHFTIGSNVQTQKLEPTSQSMVVRPHEHVTQVTAIDCAEHMKQLKGFCIEPKCQHGRRKLCVNCLWAHICPHKVQQPEFVKLLQDKLSIADFDFFESLIKVIKKDHLQKEIDELFLKIKMDFDNFLNDLYSQFMWWTKHGMGNVIKKGFISDFLLDDNVIEQIMELVLKGRPMEAEDETIDTCVELINADAEEIKLLPQHLEHTLEQCEIVIRQTLTQLEESLTKFKSQEYEFSRIPEDVVVPKLNIPGTAGNIANFGGSGFRGLPQTSFIQSPSQMGGASHVHQSTHYQQRYSSGLAAVLAPKLFIDARDLHQSQVWAVIKISQQVIASGDWQGNIKIIGITPDGQYQFMQALNHGKNVYALLLADQQTIVSAGQNAKDEWTIKVWDIERRTMIREFKGHQNYIFSIVMPNPQNLVSCSYDETIRVWDFQTGQQIRVFKEFKTSFNDLLVWNQQEIITCSDDKAVRLFNIQSGQMLMQVYDTSFVNGLARVSNQEIAVGNFKGEILIINIAEAKITRRMGSHKNFVWRVKTIDNDLIATASFDKTIKIWEWKSGSLVSSLEGHLDIVRSLEILDENALLVSSSDDKSIKIWRLYSSGANSKDLWQSVEKKQHVDPTINSMESIPSFEYQSEIEQIVQIEPPQKISLSQEPQVLNEMNYNLNTEMNDQNQQLFTNQSQNRIQIAPYKFFTKKQEAYNFADQSISSISVFNKGKYKQKTEEHTFHYDHVGEVESKIIPDNIKDPFRYVLTESLLPISIVVLSYLLIIFIQDQIGEFCFINVSNCDSYSIRFWSFCRQQYLFKLAIIFTKGHILYELQQNTNSLYKKNRKPLMEYCTLVSLAVLTDFIMIFWVGFNDDWLFIVYIQVIGTVVFFNTFRIKTWTQKLRQGGSYFLFDYTFIALLAYVFWAMPYFQKALSADKGLDNNEYFMFLYPFMDLAMEIFIDFTLSNTQYSELFIYQAQLLVLGTRVNALITGNMQRFDYWCCIFLIIVFRINNASLAFNVFIRRLIYQKTPKSLRSWTAMEETNLTLKGKHGAYYDHQLWIFWFYMFCFSGRSVTYYFQDSETVFDGSFNTNVWTNGYSRWGFQAIIVWILLIIPEIVAYHVNKKNQHDNIKYLGGSHMRLFENICVRMMGVYLFNFAISHPYTDGKYN